MDKQILYHDYAKNALKNGMQILVQAVSITLGPKGRNVVLSKKKGSPKIINDGVTIANEIELDNHIENTGALLIRQVASKTNDNAGDGTTTATVLAYAMIEEGMRNLTAGSNPVMIKKGMEKASAFVIDQICKISKSIDSMQRIEDIAAISAGNDKKIGKMIANAIEKVGREGIISLEQGKCTDIELEISEGMKIEKGFISPYFVTDKKTMEIIQENPFILLTEKNIDIPQQELVPILEKIKKTGRPLLIIAENIEKEALTTMIINKLRDNIDIVAIRVPNFGEQKKAILEDIGILTGGQVITNDLGLDFKKIELSMLGQAKKITIGKNSTVIISKENKKQVQNRCKQLRQQIEISDSNYIKENLAQRLSKLVGGIAIIKVGARTEVEMKEKKLRIEDSINATKAAIEEGIIPGGGTTFVHIYKELKFWAKEHLMNDELIGANIVANALLTPIKKIIENCGFDSSIVIDTIKTKNSNIGYDAYNNKIVNMYKEGIIDPAKVARCAMQNATSIATIVLTTECVIINKI
uniref:Chaperonin GroEL, chloroplastic n=1 Tax=Boldia erythrosiphon TaxID=74908 RepID=A0A1X9PTH4_9RHOD|nr:60 kDa chaperone protein [Boldia erythrosiphon]ARO90539.1 60 kDa chaperone protein [Boldia erythrosiphon]